MAHPDHALWQTSWRENQIDFHLPEVHPLLARFWPSLGLPAAARVFVPLCGKSRDLAWLHEQGHAVSGVELSPVAIRSFFRESRLAPRCVRRGAFTHWSCERLEIFCGDFFRLRPRDLLGVRAVYDRAALTALPEDLRPRYVAHLAAILPRDCRVLLLTVEDLDEGESAALASLASAEIEVLYGQTFEIDLRYAECLSAVQGADGELLEPRCVHKAYVLGQAVGRLSAV